MEGNLFGLCVITGTPQYREEYGAYKSELAMVYAKAKQNTPDGVQTVNLTLYFWNEMAIPSMKLIAGTQILIAGRTMSKNKIVRDKMTLETMVSVEWWALRETDPMGMLEELKVRREITVKNKELRMVFAKMMTECKDVIKGWVMEWIGENGRGHETKDQH